MKRMPPKAQDPLTAEERAFVSQRARLKRRYPGQFVALRRGRVIGHDKDDETLAARMYEQLGDAPFLIAHVEHYPVVYDVPSPELVR